MGRSFIRSCPAPKFFIESYDACLRVWDYSHGHVFVWSGDWNIKGMSKFPVEFSAQNEIAFRLKCRASPPVIAHSFLMIELTAYGCDSVAMDDLALCRPEETIGTHCAVGVVQDVIHSRAG